MRGCGDKGSRKWRTWSMMMIMIALVVGVNFLMSVDTKIGARNAVIRLKEETSMQQDDEAKFQAPPHQLEEASRRSITTATATMPTRTDNRGKASSSGHSSSKQPNEQPPNKKGRLPNFLLAGAQKSGTTAIYDYLRQLGKQVCFGQDPQTNEHQKGLHFFNHHGKELAGIIDDSDLPIEQYRVHFRHCSQPVVVDATPNYLSFAEQIHRVYRQAGSDKTLRILIMLREPVARELSWYHHLLHDNVKGSDSSWVQRIRVKEGENSGRNSATNTATSMKFVTFQESMETYSMPLIKQAAWFDSFSRYAHWIEKWLRLFDRDQIWIASYDELKHQPEVFLRKLHRFLNLTQPSAQALPRANTKNLAADAHLAKQLPPVPACDVQRSFVSFFEPYNQDLYRLLANHSQGAPAVETQPFPRFQFGCRSVW